MTEKVHDITDVPAEKTSFPWKTIMLALVTGASAAGATYLVSSRMNADFSETSDPAETPEA